MMNAHEPPTRPTLVIPASAVQVVVPTVYALFHARSPLAMIVPQVQDWLVDREQHFVHVADVQAPREAVFALTNHDDEQVWMQRPEVVWHLPQAVRSTSVGDVLQDRETGEAWMVFPTTLQALPSMPSRSTTTLLLAASQDDQQNAQCEPTQGEADGA